jgi:hypothetical protein
MSKKLLVMATLPLTAMLCFSTHAMADNVPSDNTVTSQKIREADGTSGQNTNYGAGVKTGHIQNGAVNDAKISDVAMGKVTGLQCAMDSKADQSAVDAALAGKVDTTLFNSEINSLVSDVNAADTAIQEQVNALGAAVSTKASQSELAATNATLATKADLNHGHFYGNMAVVATEGGEYTSPIDAISDLANWCGTPSVNNPCLMKIMPGVYDIGSATIVAPAYLDIDGSGKSNTIIKSYAPVDPHSGNLTAMSIKAGGNTLSNFSLVSSGNSVTPNLGGIYMKGSGTIENVNIHVSEAGRNEAIQSDGTQGDSLTIRNVVAHTHGMGNPSNMESRAIWIYGGIEDVRIDNSTIIADNADGTEGTGILDSRNSWDPWAMRLVASNSKFIVNFLHDYTLKNYSNYNPLYINSQVISNQNYYNYNFRCVNVFDENMAPMTCGNL